MPDTTISTERLEHLEHTSKRFRCLVHIWSLTTGEAPTEMLELVDELLERGINPESIHRYAAKRRRSKNSPPGNKPGGREQND